MSIDLPVITLTKRECGDCNVCCVVLDIEEGKFVKHKGVLCKHHQHGGCSIHSHKPVVCKEFFCGWLIGNVGLSLNDRPDLSGVMFMINVDEDIGMFWQAKASVPGGTKTDAARAMIKEVARHNFVYVVDGNERDLLGPAWVMEAIKKKLEKNGWKLSLSHHHQ